jgi:hypothetical protein
MKFRNLVAAAFVIGVSGVLANPAHAACAKVTATQPGEVYLMRGLANIFSLGLDQYGKELSSRGIENCVFNHSHWQSIVNDIIERSYQNAVSEPIMIVGHSLGAGVAPKMATALARHNIAVAYVAMLDPVEPTQVGGEVEEIINYYLPKKKKDNTLYAASDFSGELDNVNPRKFGDIDHFNIDENPKLKGVILTKIIERAKEPAVGSQ